MYTFYTAHALCARLLLQGWIVCRCQRRSSSQRQTSTTAVHDLSAVLLVINVKCCCGAQSVCFQRRCWGGARHEQVGLNAAAAVCLCEDKRRSCAAAQQDTLAHVSRRFAVLSSCDLNIPSPFLPFSLQTLNLCCSDANARERPVRPTRSALQRAHVCRALNNDC